MVATMAMAEGTVVDTIMTPILEATQEDLCHETRRQVLQGAKVDWRLSGVTRQHSGDACWCRTWIHM